jgi:hypothetical protein
MQTRGTWGVLCARTSSPGGGATAELGVEACGARGSVEGKERFVGVGMAMHTSIQYLAILRLMYLAWLNGVLVAKVALR